MRRGTAWLVVAGLLGGCGASGDGSAGASASESTGAASTGSSGAPTTSGEATGTGEASSSGTPTTGGSEGLTTGSSGDTSTSAASGTSGGDTSTGAVGSSSSGGGDTSTGAPVNQPPVWDSEPGLAIVLVSHDLPVITARAHTILYLDRRVRWHGAARAFRADVIMGDGDAGMDLGDRKSVV